MTHAAPRTQAPIGIWWKLTILLAVAGAAWLGSVSFTANLDHACQSRQWPGFDHCLTAPGGTVTGPAGPEWDRMRERVAANPGDGLTMAGMARYAGAPAAVIGLDGSKMLDLVSRVAPNRAEVLQQQAVRALARSDWARAVPPLVQLALKHGDAEATRSLARLMVVSSQDPGLLDVLRASTKGNADWVDRALRAVPAEKLPMWATMSLVAELLQRDAIKQPTGLLVVRQLKAEGRWLDAHAVWLQLWKRPLDLLYNGGFEREFVRDTFDWDTADGEPNRIGAEVERVGMGARGKVLRIRFNGRPLKLPLLRHDLLLPAGTYRFEGDFRATDIRNGLQWTMTCAQGGHEIARSAPLLSGGSEWSRTSMELNVSGDCQSVVLALWPQTLSEARGGLQGELLLDRIGLVRLPGIPESPSR